MSEEDESSSASEEEAVAVAAKRVVDTLDVAGSPDRGNQASGVEVAAGASARVLVGTPIQDNEDIMALLASDSEESANSSDSAYAAGSASDDEPLVVNTRSKRRKGAPTDPAGHSAQAAAATLSKEPGIDVSLIDDEFEFFSASTNVFVGKSKRTRHSPISGGTQSLTPPPPQLAGKTPGSDADDQLEFGHQPGQRFASSPPPASVIMRSDHHSPSTRPGQPLPRHRQRNSSTSPVDAVLASRTDKRKRHTESNIHIVSNHQPGRRHHCRADAPGSSDTNSGRVKDLARALINSMWSLDDPARSILTNVANGNEELSGGRAEVVGHSCCLALG